jgi:hypothetical protein
MKMIKYDLQMIVIISFLGILTISCAQSQFLRVRYQLPSEPNSLQGMAVSIVYEDMRINKNSTTASAKKELKDFSNEFTLIVARDANGEKLLGVFDLHSLVKETFKQRLENSGIQVRDQADSDQQIKIILKKFLIDYQNRKWLMTISYQLSLISAGKTVITETVSGEAERLKVMGNKEAEKVVSDLLTDMVNKIDLQQFFKVTN